MSELAGFRRSRLVPLIRSSNAWREEESGNEPFQAEVLYDFAEEMLWLKAGSADTAPVWIKVIYSL